MNGKGGGERRKLRKTAKVVADGASGKAWEIPQGKGKESLLRRSFSGQLAEKYALDTTAVWTLALEAPAGEALP